MSAEANRHARRMGTCGFVGCCLLPSRFCCERTGDVTRLETACACTQAANCTLRSASGGRPHRSTTFRCTCASSTMVLCQLIIRAIGRSIRPNRHTETLGIAASRRREHGVDTAIYIPQLAPDAPDWALEVSPTMCPPPARRCHCLRLSASLAVATRLGWWRSSYAPTL